MSTVEIPDWFRVAHQNLPHPHRRDSGEDIPWSMPIVLEIPKREKPSRRALLEASASAVVACCLDQRAANPESAFYHGLNSWYGERIRKISRRARGIGWERAQNVPGVTVEKQGARARALLPTPVGETYPEIAKLQISGTDLPREEESQPNAAQPEGSQPEAASRRPTIWVDSDLEMSVGKTAAQVGHGSMLLAAVLPVHEALEWAEAGFPVNVREVPRSQWPAPEARVVEVRDAGFTEIAPGSVTVCVTTSG